MSIRIGETKLTQLPRPTRMIGWRAGAFKREAIDDVEPFDDVLVQWRDNGRITFACCALPPKDAPDRAEVPRAKESSGTRVLERI